MLSLLVSMTQRKQTLLYCEYSYNEFQRHGICKHKLCHFISFSINARHSIAVKFNCFLCIFVMSRFPISWRVEPESVTGQTPGHNFLNEKWHTFEVGPLTGQYFQNFSDCDRGRARNNRDRIVSELVSCGSCGNLITSWFEIIRFYEDYFCTKVNFHHFNIRDQT